jgi:hypothetical protein
MANGRSDDFATKDIRKTVVCDVGDLPTEFESENSTVTEPDGTIATTSLSRFYVLPDGTVWEATPDGLKKRDDLGVCIPCWRPVIRPFWRRRSAKVIRSRDVLKACADCGQLLCRDHRAEFSSDSSRVVYRCLACTVRYAVRHSCQFLFFRRA